MSGAGRDGRTPRRTIRLIHEAVRAITYSIGALSGDLDITYVTLFNYRMGRRSRIPPEFLTRLAEVLRRQAKRLGRLARQLQRAGRRNKHSAPARLRSSSSEE